MSCNMGKLEKLWGQIPRKKERRYKILQLFRTNMNFLKNIKGQLPPSSSSYCNFALAMAKSGVHRY